MSRVQVLLIAGTHGNELNASWLFDQWTEKIDLVKTSGISVFREIGNPLARKASRRYLDRDLNRCFSSELLSSVKKIADLDFILDKISLIPIEY